MCQRPQPYISDLYAPELKFKGRLDTVGNGKKTCDWSKCEEHSPGHNDDDCCSLDQHVFCGDGYQVSKVKKGEDVNWIIRHERGLSCSQGGGYRGNTGCSPYGESNDAADMTPSNMSIARFVGTGNSGEVFVPEPKKVLYLQNDNVRYY